MKNSYRLNVSMLQANLVIGAIFVKIRILNYARFTSDFSVVYILRVLIEASVKGRRLKTFLGPNSDS